MKYVSYAKKRNRYPAIRLGKDLTSKEQGKITGLALADWNVTSIAKIIKQSRKVVCNYLNYIRRTHKTEKLRKKAKINASPGTANKKRIRKRHNFYKKLLNRLQVNVHHKTIRLV